MKQCSSYRDLKLSNSFFFFFPPLILVPCFFERFFLGLLFTEGLVLGIVDCFPLGIFEGLVLGNSDDFTDGFSLRFLDGLVLGIVDCSPLGIFEGLIAHQGHKHRLVRNTRTRQSIKKYQEVRIGTASNKYIFPPKHSLSFSRTAVCQRCVTKRQLSAQITVICA